MMGYRIEGYHIPQDDMGDYLWITQRLAEFDRSVFGPMSDVQHVFIARFKEDGSRLGGCAVSSRFGWMHIERLWVEVDHRGDGIGRRLLRAAEMLALDQAFMGMRLVTTDRHTGMRLYAQMGFHVDYRLPGRLDNGSPIQEIGLVKRFCDHRKNPA